MIRHPLARRSTLAALALGLLSAGASVAADGPYVTTVATATWQDNITDAPSGDGVLGAFTLGSTTDVSWLASLGFSTLLTYGVESTLEICPRFSGLDSFSWGPRISWRHKLGVGPYAPFVTVGLEGSAVAFSDHERSRIEGVFTAGGGQRLNDAVQLLVDARAGTYNANDLVYGGNYVGANATLNWDVSGTWRIKLLGGWRSGDGVSNYAAQFVGGAWTPIDPGILNSPGWWHYVNTYNQPFTAFRLGIRTLSSGIGVCPAIGRHTSLALQFVRLDSKGYDRYADDVASASIVHRF